MRQCCCVPPLTCGAVRWAGSRSRSRIATSGRCRAFSTASSRPKPRPVRLPRCPALTPDFSGGRRHGADCEADGQRADPPRACLRVRRCAAAIPGTHNTRPDPTAAVSCTLLFQKLVPLLLDEACRARLKTDVLLHAMQARSRSALREVTASQVLASRRVPELCFVFEELCLVFESLAYICGAPETVVRRLAPPHMLIGLSERAWRRSSGLLPVGRRS